MGFAFLCILCIITESITFGTPVFEFDAETLLSSNITQEYSDWPQIESWLYAIDTLFDVVDVINIGTTYENRSILLAKISKDDGMVKPGVFIDGGVHAREWISPVTVINTITKILNESIHESNDDNLLNYLDLYFIPVVNPDGYTFTHTEESARRWRKNRSPVNNGCIGVDLNRNWDYRWGEGERTDNPCTELYHGAAPFSEAETQAVSEFILAHNDTLKSYVTLHSYSQIILYRWSYHVNATNELDPSVAPLAEEIVEAIYDVHGAVYRTGTSPDLLYAYSGGSGDWATAVAGIPYSYSVELRDTGEYGFILPTDQIVPVAEEMWAGFSVLFNHLKHKYPPVPKYKATTMQNEFTQTEMLNDLQNMTSTPDFKDGTSSSVNLQLSFILYVLILSRFVI